MEGGWTNLSEKPSDQIVDFAARADKLYSLEITITSSQFPHPLRTPMNTPDGL
jgi:hypothetical protein